MFNTKNKNMKIDTITLPNIKSNKLQPANSTYNRAENNNKILYSTLGVLAVIAVAGLLYRKGSVKNSQTLIKSSTYQDLKQSISSNQLIKVEQEASKLDNYKLFSKLEISHDTDIFKRFTALMRLEDSKNIELPKLITTNASDGKLDEICNFFESEFKFSTGNLTYKGNAQEFIKELNNKYCIKNDKSTCIMINNFDNFVKDLNNDVTLKQDFINILESNKNNNTILIGNVSSKDAIKLYNKMFLPFKK